MDKDYLSIIFVGHVDVGKSTISGQLLVSTGMVDNKTLERNDEDLSNLLDTTEEEKNRGITIELGRSYFQTSNKDIILLDAPGHKNLVPNAIEGIIKADIIVYVISAKNNEFEADFIKSKQIRELMITGNMFADTSVILINKMDAVNWDEKRFNYCKNILYKWYKSLNPNIGTIPIFPCSGKNGDFLTKKSINNLSRWYKGPTFLEFLDNLEKYPRFPNLPLKITITKESDYYIGKVINGTLIKGDQVTIIPNKIDVKIDTFSDLKSEETLLDIGKTGHLLKIRLPKEITISSGSVICKKSNPCNSSKKILVDAIFFRSPLTGIITCGAKFMIHTITTSQNVVVDKIISSVNKDKVTKKNPTFIKKNEKCKIILECDELICIERHEDHKKFGTIIIREFDGIIGTGTILDYFE